MPPHSNSHLLWMGVLHKSKAYVCKKANGTTYKRVARIPDELALTGIKLMGGPANVPASQVSFAIEAVSSLYVPNLDEYQWPKRQSYQMFRRVIPFIVKVQVGMFLTHAHWRKKAKSGVP
jgi:hypothetical protein